MRLVLAVFLGTTALAQTWVEQRTETTASLRGVSAVSASVVWASGAGGTWLRTIDGGATWRAATVQGATDLDFRGVKGIDERTAFLMSSGPGDKSRVYKTTDAGNTWQLLFTNPDPLGFFDAVAFRDAQNGIVAGDPVDGEMAIFTTNDGGVHWLRRHTPPALPNEGAFAASNSCLTPGEEGNIWFGTGGPAAARVFHSTNGGVAWTVATTPIRSDAPSAGIFSLAFSDARHGIAVGGDYAKDSEPRQNIAVTSDGGRTWTKPSGIGPKGFRSAIIWLAAQKIWIATGTSGSDISADGKTWRNFDGGSWNALSSSGGSVWAAGVKGRIGLLKLNAY